MKKNFFIIAVLMLMTSTSLFADSNASAALTGVVDVIKDLISNTFTIIGSIILIIIAAYQSHEAGNLSPIKWAVFAIIVMVSAINFLPDFISSVRTSIGG